MKHYKKKNCVLLILTLSLTVAIIQTPEAQPSSFMVQEEALSVITNLIGIDMAKYDVELSNYALNCPDIYGGLSKETVIYTLKSTEGNFKISCSFVNETLIDVDFSTIDSPSLSPMYSQPMPATIIDITKVILQRIQNYSGAEYIQIMSNSIKTVTNVESVNATIDNLERLALVNGDFTSIYFMYTVNGARSPKSVVLHFKNGVFEGFSNKWELYEIGSKSISISQNEAVDIAKDQAQKFIAENLQFANGTRPEIEITLLDAPIETELSMVARETLTLYPFWFVQLYIDSNQSSIVSGVQVGIWADTGKIEYCHASGYHGVIPITDSSPTASPQEPPSNGNQQTTSIETLPSPETAIQNNSNPFMSTYAAIAITTLFIAIAVTVAVAFRRKRK